MRRIVGSKEVELGTGQPCRVRPLGPRVVVHAEVAGQQRGNVGQAGGALPELEVGPVDHEGDADEVVVQGKGMGEQAPPEILALDFALAAPALHLLEDLEAGGEARRLAYPCVGAHRAGVPAPPAHDLGQHALALGLEDASSALGSSPRSLAEAECSGQGCEGSVQLAVANNVLRRRAAGGDPRDRRGSPGRRAVGSDALA
ncbi:MAG: hypothetical protein M3375_06940, partial [Actinomycetota bacterium]|nr:hypothetical protein [Actinomycetota bacterium]